MLTFERPVIIESGRIDEARRTMIGAQVLNIEFMRKTSQFIRSYNTAHENGIVFNNEVDTIAQKIMHRLDDREFAIARDDLMNAAPNSTSHIARQHMEHATKSYEKDGNVKFGVNADFVVATHYLEDRVYAEKLDAEIGVSELIEPDFDSMVEFYTAKAIANIEAHQHHTDLRTIVATSGNDIAYWIKN